MAQSDNEYFPWDFNSPLRDDCTLDIPTFRDMLNKLMRMVHCVASLFQAKIISKQLCYENEVLDKTSIKLAGIGFTEIDGCPMIFQNGLKVGKLYGDVRYSIQIEDNCAIINFIDSSGDPLPIGVGEACVIEASIPYKVAITDCINCFPARSTTANCGC